MYLLPFVLFFVIVPSAIHSCDPQTQYENGDQCCKKCGPGTRMSMAICLDPQCTACEENEYQDGYTDKTSCERQPYCDPNSNFEFVSHKSKTSRTTCTCKLGYHCSSKACLTCVPHSTCKPGERVQYKGNHTYDTVCQKCPAGTFSNGILEESDCESWTVCGPGFKVITMGTATSDTICERGRRLHMIWVVVPLIILVAFLAFVFYKCKGHSQQAKHKVEDCVKMCINSEHVAETGTFTRMEDKVQDRHENVATPEESDYPNEPVLTDNGNLIAQEDGKRDTVSRQESHSLISYMSDS